MNRHERRKQKKLITGVNAVQSELLKAIQLHTQKDLNTPINSCC